MLKALLISTLIAGSNVNGDSSVDTEQMHIWFQGSSAHVDCDRTKQLWSLKGQWLLTIRLQVALRLITVQLNVL